MNVWQTLLSAFGGTVALLGLLAYLGQSLIKNFLDKNIEVYKAQLKLEEIESTERLKAALQVANAERGVKFTNLHAKRAGVIAEVYGQLVEVKWAGNMATTPLKGNGGPTEQQALQKAEECFLKLFKTFNINRIYLPIEVANDLDALIVSVNQSLNMYQAYNWVDQYASDSTLREKSDAMIAAFEFFSEGIRDPLLSLESSFRKMLDPV